MELYHYGVLGMKWGVRRYQNPDGSLTDLGKKRLAKDIANASKQNDWSSLGSKYSDEIDPRAIKNLESIKDALTDYRDACDKYKDFYESKECREASNKAYKDTIEYFRKYDPEYLKNALKFEKEHEEHPKEYEGHPKKDLTGLHDFRKIYEGYESEYWAEAENKYLSDPKNKRGEQIKENAYNAYISECKKAAYDLVGEYGNKKVKTLGTKESFSINDIAVYSVRELVRWKRESVWG